MFYQIKRKIIEKIKNGTFSIENNKINSNIERINNNDNKIGKILSNSETNLVLNVSNKID